MQHEIVHYSGCYHYADSETLERASVRARAKLADLDEPPESLRFFKVQATTLIVNVTVSLASAQRLAAANMYLALSQEALDGVFHRRP